MIHYRIVYSKRRSIGITIGPDSGVIVRAPWRTSAKTIENLIQSKSSWIKKHLENHSSFIRLSRDKEYTDGESHYYRGRQFFLRIVQSKTGYIKLYESIIEIGLKIKADKEIVRPLLETWYKRMAEELFRKKLDELLTRYSFYSFSPANFAVRLMKGRWGSCSSKGKITLSSELVKLDDKFTEYVMLHELCHLKHHNHSAEFYQLLSDVYPEWKNVRKELRRYIR
jgi:predicted metal-dependent hydrolase